MKGIWKFEIELGFALCGLAGLGIITIILFPQTYGLLLLAITFGVAVLTSQATKDFEKVKIISVNADNSQEKLDAIKKDISKIESQMESMTEILKKLSNEILSKPNK